MEMDRASISLHIEVDARATFRTSASDESRWSSIELDEHNSVSLLSHHRLEWLRSLRVAVDQAIAHEEARENAGAAEPAEGAVCER